MEAMRALSSTFFLAARGMGRVPWRAPRGLSSRDEARRAVAGQARARHPGGAERRGAILELGGDDAHALAVALQEKAIVGHLADAPHHLLAQPLGQAAADHH